MKKTLVLLLLPLLLLCACAPKTAQVYRPSFEVRAIKADARDGSKLIQPRLKLSDKALEKTINEKIEKTLMDRYLAVKGDTDGATEENFRYFSTGNLLTLVQDGYYYVPGAAHGLPYRTYLNIDLQTGRFYQLREDAFERFDEYGFEHRLALEVG